MISKQELHRTSFPVNRFGEKPSSCELDISDSRIANMGKGNFLSELSSFARLIAKDTQVPRRQVVYIKPRLTEDGGRSGDQSRYDIMCTVYRQNKKWPKANHIIRNIMIDDADESSVREAAFDSLESAIKRERKPAESDFVIRRENGVLIVLSAYESLCCSY